jgi:type II secretory pathway pseudopilin PulG
MRLVGEKRIAAFTLAEVLAALVFMAIVIPVAVEALRVASRAGEVSYRKTVAARVAERVLNEMVVTSQTQGISQTGVADEGQQQYRWTIRSEPWTQDAMLLVRVEVLFAVQGRDYDVHLSTLVSNGTQ